MKLRKKLVVFLMCSLISVPSFAMVQIPDTFTYSNIANTMLGDDDKYIIASDNTVMGRGTNIQGLSSSGVNTNGLWKNLVIGPNGVTLNNIVKVARNYKDTYALSSTGDAYHLNGYPKRIQLDSEKDVKFKDVAESYYYVSYDNSLSSVIYLISEGGGLYKGRGTTFTKVENVDNAESTHVSHALVGKYSNKPQYTSVGLVKTVTKEIYKVNYHGEVSKVENVTDVEDIYPAYGGFYLRFSSGVIAFTDESCSSIIQLNTPSGEEFLNIFSAGGYAGLVTDKDMYSLSGVNLTKTKAINTSDQSSIIPVAFRGNLCIDNLGKYYTWVVSGVEFHCTPITGIEEWANDNPIVLESELANFEIPLNKIFKRLENYEFNFNLVTQDVPKQFNVYFCKNEDRNDKLKWKLIEGGVDVSTLNQKVYDTGYVNASGKPITGFSYTYNWKIGNDDLVGVHLIVEPIYN